MFFVFVFCLTVVVDLVAEFTAVFSLALLELCSACNFEKKVCFGFHYKEAIKEEFSVISFMELE